MNPLVYIFGVFLRPAQTIKDENAVPLTGSLVMPIILMLVLSLYTAGVSEIIIRYIIPEQVSFSASIFVIGLSFFIWILLFFAAGFYSLYLPVKILNGYPPSHRKAMHDHGVINIWCLSILLVICMCGRVRIRCHTADGYSKSDHPGRSHFDSARYGSILCPLMHDFFQIQQGTGIQAI